MNYRFKELRENTFDESGKEMSVMELSRKLNIDHHKIDRLEGRSKGFKTIEPDTLKAYADFFGVSFDYLLGYRDEKTTDEDIKMICRVTGLSEDVVNKLKAGKSWSNRSVNKSNAKAAGKAFKYKHYPNVVNALLENDCCSILQRIFDYLSFDAENVAEIVIHPKDELPEMKQINEDDDIAISDKDGYLIALYPERIESMLFAGILDGLRDIKKACMEKIKVIVR